KGAAGGGNAKPALRKRQTTRHLPLAPAADGADRDRKSKPPPCRRRVDLAKLAIAQIQGTARQRIHDADLSWPACVVNPARSHGSSSQIVCERLYGVLTAKRLAVFAA